MTSLPAGALVIWLSALDTRPETLRAQPLVPLEHALQEKALRAYQAVQHNSQAPSTLSEAGLLALALRERRRLTGTWSGLLQEIFPEQPNSLIYRMENCAGLSLYDGA